MKFVFSKDYTGAGFGFLTKARMFDKWGHFGGSAAGVLLFVALIRLAFLLGGMPWNPVVSGICIWIGAAMTFAIGLGYEIYQGIEEAKIKEDIGEAAWIARGADGFSLLDLLSNVGGIALVVWIVVL